jgi:hypothetical protein
MSRVFLFLMISFFAFSATISCTGKKGKLGTGDTSRWTDQDVPLEELPAGNVNTDSLLLVEKMKQLFLPGDSLIEGRPVSYYLNRGDVSVAAKNFYLLRLQPSQDEATFSILDSLCSKNDTTRPFYYFLFLRFYKLGEDWVNDAELLPGYAIEYSLDFVDEFYKKLQMPQYKWSFPYWVKMLSLNKFPVDDIRTYLIGLQTKRTKQMTPKLRKQIAAFADSIVSHNARE